MAVVVGCVGFKKSSGKSLRKARERSVATLELGAVSDVGGSLKLLSVAIGFPFVRREPRRQRVPRTGKERDTLLC